LQRRHVYKIGAAYVVAGWLAVQVVTQVFPIFNVSALAQRIIVLVIIAGFPVTLVLTWLFDITSRGVVRTGDLPEGGEAPEVRRERRGTDRKLNYVLGLLLLCALGYVVFDHVLLRRASTEAGDAARSIAVLPLVNTSGDPANDYFSDGLSEELIAVLAKIPGLKIIGRSSSFLFKGKADDSRTIGEKLGVANLLEGSVRKQGDRVRIVAELINAADGRALWSETYDRELKDVFAVQSEIATAVTEQLKIKLLGAPVKSDAAPSNDNLAAYNALQQGTFYFRLSTEEGTRKATELYGEAIRLDPRYALAYAQLSGAWRQLAATWLSGAEANEAYAKARNAAQTALSLAPNLAAAHEALGFVFVTPDFDLAAAEAEFRKAEKLGPGRRRTQIRAELSIRCARSANGGREDNATDAGTRSVRRDSLLESRPHPDWRRPIRRSRGYFAQSDRASTSGGSPTFLSYNHRCITWGHRGRAARCTAGVERILAGLRAGFGAAGAE
jgi:serine/threonine-protein kinase